MGSGWITLLLSVSVSVVVALVAYAVRFGRLEANQRHLEADQRVLADRLSRLTDSLNENSREVAKYIAATAVKLEYYEQFVHVGGNPITENEYREFLNMRNLMAHHGILTLPELDRFVVLAGKVEQDLPSNEQRGFFELVSKLITMTLSARQVASGVWCHVESLADGLHVAVDGLLPNRALMHAVFSEAQERTLRQLVGKEGFVGRIELVHWLRDNWSDLYEKMQQETDPRRVSVAMTIALKDHFGYHGDAEPGRT